MSDVTGPSYGEDEVGDSSWRRDVRRVLVIAFSLFHLAAIAAWLAPSGYLRDKVVDATRDYMLYTRTDQGWGMFAPEPLSVNRRLVVEATLPGGEIREVDLTLPFNQALHSWSLQRVGKEVKAHDRLMAGDEPQYLGGFARHVCLDLSSRWSTPVTSLRMRRFYQTISVTSSPTFRTARSPWSWGEIGTYECPRS